MKDDEKINTYMELANQMICNYANCNSLSTFRKKKGSDNWIFIIKILKINFTFLEL